MSGCITHGFVGPPTRPETLFKIHENVAERRRKQSGEEGARVPCVIHHLRMSEEGTVDHVGTAAWKDVGADTRTDFTPNLASHFSEVYSLRGRFDQRHRVARSSFLSTRPMK